MHLVRALGPLSRLAPLPAEQSVRREDGGEAARHSERDESQDPENAPLEFVDSLKLELLAGSARLRHGETQTDSAPTA